MMRVRYRTSADLSWGVPRAAPATQNDTEVLQVLRLPRKRSRRPQYSIVAGLLRTSLDVLRVLHLPRKMRRRCSKCCACHANAAGAHNTQSSPDFRGPFWRWLQVLHLPSKMSLSLSGCAPRAAPATQNDTEVLQVLRLPLKRSRRPQYSIVARLPRTSLDVPRVLHLPRKMRLRCSMMKC